MKKRALYGPIRESLMVKRYHTMMHVNMPETVAHHTCNVIGLLFHLYNDEPPIHVIRAALHHDVAEYVTGDIPAPAKWAFPELAAASKKIEEQTINELGLTALTDPMEIELLKFADMMDLCFKCVEEVSAGNEPFYPVLTRGLHSVLKQLDSPLKGHKEAKELLQMLVDNPYVEIHLERIDDDRKASRIVTH